MQNLGNNCIKFEILANTSYTEGKRFKINCKGKLGLYPSFPENRLWWC